MRRILPEVSTLEQYLLLFEQGILLGETVQCLHCGRSGLWRHGHYDRKADRCNESESLNPIPIQRFLCRYCGKTCSVLPECIPPHRWYLWEVQQLALLLWLTGKSFYAVAKKTVPSRQTIKRWADRLQEQFHLHKDALCNLFVDLGRTPGFADFWSTCLNKIPLSSAMRLCHVSGVIIP
jgi:transposase-like protein